jgi:DNA/RNA-binding domain of Phe-tRNA-synthetase-like protein
MAMITVGNEVPREDLALGLVRVEPIAAGPAPEALAGALDLCVEKRRAAGLTPDEEKRRAASRDLLRNGRYKPTGRGKPASEYLLRAAQGGEFPRISGPVDANNLVSLEHLVAVSLVDLDAATELAAAPLQLEVRLGRAGERYVFNAAGQVLELEDLLCGCVLGGKAGSVPVATPVKDSLATKLTPSTRRVLGCIYYPTTAGQAGELARITEELLGWLRLLGPEGADATMALAGRGEQVTL